MVNAPAGKAGEDGGVDTATCDRDCTAPACGDGLVNLAAGEECETGGESSFCDGDCTFAWCGDGVRNAAAGEECDDGDTDDGDWCLTTCERGYFTREEGGLTQTWYGERVFMNPPYGRQIGLWVAKAYTESKGALVVCLIPSSTDTRYWHDYVMKAD